MCCMGRTSLAWVLISISCIITARRSSGQTAQLSDTVLVALNAHAYDVESSGRTFLLSEARKNDYFLLGELHGDNEIPRLIHALWPEMWNAGYRFVAAEVSPWTADRLEADPDDLDPRIEGLWTRAQADDLHSIAGRATKLVWGCDMEEIHPEHLIRELAKLNPEDTSLKQMLELTENGYRRNMAPELLKLFTTGSASVDRKVNDISLRQNLLQTLQIEQQRAEPATKMAAQNERELLMKTQFLAHLRAQADPKRPNKVLLRFGRNHLHRGFDARGISTLGNFIAEFAVSEGQRAFNVGAFGAGGKASLMGETFSMDERSDEPTFALLAAQAKSPATVFDLRPIRPLLHAIPADKRTPLESNLIYWSDAYDALICYKNVTPVVH
jgi:hypothetical protein